MYGIMTQSGHMVLCHSFLSKDTTYSLKRWDRASLPVMYKSPYEIDQLMQEFMVASNYYNLQVFQFTVEQEETLIMRRLRGH